VSYFFYGKNGKKVKATTVCIFQKILPKVNNHPMAQPGHTGFTHLASPHFLGCNAMSVFLNISGKIFHFRLKIISSVNDIDFLRIIAIFFLQHW
jgi:hypothetical protein